MCRHTVGLNYTSFGIEHVGRSEAGVFARRRQLRASLALVAWLQDRYGIRTRNVIGHNESLAQPVPPRAGEAAAEADARRLPAPVRAALPRVARAAARARPARARRRGRVLDVSPSSRRARTRARRLHRRRPPRGDALRRSPLGPSPNSAAKSSGSSAWSLLALLDRVLVVGGLGSRVRGELLRGSSASSPCRAGPSPGRPCGRACGRPSSPSAGPRRSGRGRSCPACRRTRPGRSRRPSAARSALHSLAAFLSGPDPWRGRWRGLRGRRARRRARSFLMRGRSAHPPARLQAARPERTVVRARSSRRRARDPARPCGTRRAAPVAILSRISAACDSVISPLFDRLVDDRLRRSRARGAGAPRGRRGSRRARPSRAGRRSGPAHAGSSRPQVPAPRRAGRPPARP